jgi:hypothetical protein
MTSFFQSPSGKYEPPFQKNIPFSQGAEGKTFYNSHLLLASRHMVAALLLNLILGNELHQGVLLVCKPSKRSWKTSQKELTIFPNNER